MKFRLKALCLVLALAVCPVFGFDGVPSEDPLFGLQGRVFQVLDQQWRVNDLLVAAQATPQDADIVDMYETQADRLGRLEAQLGKEIAEALSARDSKALDLVGSIYRSLDAGARIALFPVLNQVRAGLAGEPALQARIGEYFPGYGYPEPGYKYRRGREIAREEKGTTWQYEEHTITSAKTIKLTVNIDVLGILKSLFSLGRITNLVVGREYNSYYNGQPMIVFDVMFSTSETIFTKANRKYEVSKVWFELQRSSDAGWNNSGTWETVGKTFQIMMDPTGEAVTTEVGTGQQPIPGTGTPAPAPLPTPAPSPTVPFAN